MNSRKISGSEMKLAVSWSHVLEDSAAGGLNTRSEAEAVRTVDVIMMYCIVWLIHLLCEARSNPQKPQTTSRSIHNWQTLSNKKQLEAEDLYKLNEARVISTRHCTPKSIWATGP